MPPQLRATAADDSSVREPEAELHRHTHDSAESRSMPEQTTAELLPKGMTLHLTNPVFSQQGDGVLQNPMGRPEANVGVDPSMAESADAPQGCTDQSAEGDHISNPSMAEGLAEGKSALTMQQLQQQLQELRSALNTQALQLQTSEAGREYIHRLLNAVTAEPKHAAAVVF